MAAAARLLLDARRGAFARLAMSSTGFWSRRWVGDTLLVLFLLAQVFDGAFTYVGIVTLGVAIEWNPLLAWWMSGLGVGPALAGAKIVAGSCGIVLHMTRVHRAIAVLTALYVVLAIVPWTSILFLAD